MTGALDLSAIADRLMLLVLRYEEWSIPQKQYIEQNLSRINVDGYTSNQFRSGLKELHERMVAEDDPFVEIREVMDEVCPAYLVASTDERERLRSIVADLNDLSMLIRGYADTLSSEILSPNDTEKLRCGLAAISIENCRTDSRDTMLSLADLFVGAEEVGIDPLPYFQELSELSSSATPTGGNTSVAEMFREFHEYAVIAERRRNGDPYRHRKTR